MLSARFPLISPPGNLRNEAGQIIARVVDGGYYENFGATTAREIVEQLKKQDLRPFVIEITNDPKLLAARTVRPSGTTPCEKLKFPDPLQRTDPPVVDAQDDLWFSGIASPIDGLLSSRGAQGGQALLELRRILMPDGFVHIYVNPYYRRGKHDDSCRLIDVSMSWWLSKPVQHYLDMQLYLNHPAFRQIESLLRVSDKTTN